MARASARLSHGGPCPCTSCSGIGSRDWMTPRGTPSRRFVNRGGAWGAVADVKSRALGPPSTCPATGTSTPTFARPGGLGSHQDSFVTQAAGMPPASEQHLKMSVPKSTWRQTGKVQALHAEDASSNRPSDPVAENRTVRPLGNLIFPQTVLVPPGPNS